MLEIDFVREIEFHEDVKDVCLEIFEETTFKSLGTLANCSLSSNN